ncbi:DUF1836 domain-containing protein [Paenibacillus sediminis]
MTREQASDLLRSIRGDLQKTPLSILQDAWHHTLEKQKNTVMSLDAINPITVPSIVNKIMKMNSSQEGLSLNDIVALGNLIEFNEYAITSVQNWVKRDIRDILGTPKCGKKYSIDQAAVLLIVEDLKATLDFESIRKLLKVLFNNPNDDQDDLISPIDFYHFYATLIEEMKVQAHNVKVKSMKKRLEQSAIPYLTKMIKNKADERARSLEHLHTSEQDQISNALVVAVVSVQAAYYQSIAKRALNAAVYL